MGAKEDKKRAEEKKKAEAAKKADAAKKEAARKKAEAVKKNAKPIKAQTIVADTRKKLAELLKEEEKGSLVGTLATTLVVGVLGFVGARLWQAKQSGVNTADGFLKFLLKNPFEKEKEDVNERLVLNAAHIKWLADKGRMYHVSDVKALQMVIAYAKETATSTPHSLDDVIAGRLAAHQVEEKSAAFKSLEVSLEHAQDVWLRRVTKATDKDINHTVRTLCSWAATQPDKNIFGTDRSEYATRLRKGSILTHPLDEGGFQPVLRQIAEETAKK